MKRFASYRSARIASTIAAALGLLSLAGCLEKRVVWSPDGTRAVVVSEQGLYISDATGKLSPRLATDVYQAAWLGDSEHLVLARERRVGSWSALVEGMGEDRAARIASRAEEVWKELQQGGIWSVLMMGSSDDNDGVRLYLREHHSEGLRARVGESWNEIAEATAGLDELVHARAAGDHLEIGAPLHAGFDRINEIRPSPRGRLVAFVTEMDGDDDFGMTYVTAGDNRETCKRVADRTAAYPDWTTDGRSLVYVQGLGDATAGDELSLGTVVRRRVVNDAGDVEIADDSEELAGLMFSVLARVRCLRDGRILFNAAELCLPMAASDAQVQREQLFVLDTVRQPTLTRLIPRKAERELPEVLAFFEVNPDETQLLFGGTDGEVCLLTLATGAVEVVQAKGGGLQGAPVWHHSGAFSYLRRTEEQDGKEPVRKAELVLRRRNEETVLSRAWTDDLVNAVVK